MSADIKAPLDAAARAYCFGPNGDCCDKCIAPWFCIDSAAVRPNAAAAIAAFLEEQANQAEGKDWNSYYCNQLRETARKVRKEAARDE